MTGFLCGLVALPAWTARKNEQFAGSSSEAPVAPSTMAQTPWLAVAGNELVCRAQRVQGSITRRKPSKRSPLGSTSLRCGERVRPTGHHGRSHRRIGIDPLPSVRELTDRHQRCRVRERCEVGLEDVATASFRRTQRPNSPGSREQLAAGAHPQRPQRSHRATRLRPRRRSSRTPRIPVARH